MAVENFLVFHRRYSITNRDTGMANKKKKKIPTHTHFGDNQAKEMIRETKLSTKANKLHFMYQ